jgi:hypothetical protein
LVTADPAIVVIEHDIPQGVNGLVVRSKIDETKVSPQRLARIRLLSASPTKQIVAERDGLPRRSQKPNKIRHFLQAKGRRVYQSCVPKSMRIAPPVAQY